MSSDNENMEIEVIVREPNVEIYDDSPYFIEEVVTFIVDEIDLIINNRTSICGLSHKDVKNYIKQIQLCQIKAMALIPFLGDDMFSKHLSNLQNKMKLIDPFIQKLTQSLTKPQIKKICESCHKNLTLDKFEMIVDTYEQTGYKYVYDILCFECNEYFSSSYLVDELFNDKLAYEIGGILDVYESLDSISHKEIKKIMAELIQKLNFGMKLIPVLKTYIERHSKKQPRMTRTYAEQLQFLKETMIRVLPFISSLKTKLTESEQLKYCPGCKRRRSLDNFPIVYDSYSRGRIESDYNSVCTDCNEREMNLVKERQAKYEADSIRRYQNDGCQFASTNCKYKSSPCNSYSRSCSMCNVRFCSIHMDHAHLAPVCDIYGCNGFTIRGSNRCVAHHNNKIFIGVGSRSSNHKKWREYK